MGVTLFLGTSQSFYDSQINIEIIDTEFVTLSQAKIVSEETLNYLTENNYELNSSLIGITAKEHMKDVKNLKSVASYSFFILLLLLFISFLTLAIVHKPKRIRTSLAYGSILTIILNLILFLISQSFFRSFWRNFHKVLFRNNLWQLNPSTDNLVAVFTLNFFTQFVAYLIVITTLLASIILTISLIKSKKKSTKEQLNAEFAW